MARPQHGGMRDMTVGSPAKQILLFTLPLLAGNFLQQLYNMVDSWVVETTSAMRPSPPWALASR